MTKDGPCASRQRVADKIAQWQMEQCLRSMPEDFEPAFSERGGCICYDGAASSDVDGSTCEIHIGFRKSENPVYNQACSQALKQVVWQSREMIRVGLGNHLHIPLEATH